MTDREETFAKVAELIEPFNKKGVDLKDGTTSPATWSGTA